MHQNLNMKPQEIAIDKWANPGGGSKSHADKGRAQEGQFFRLRTQNKGHTLSMCTVWLMSTVGLCLKAGRQKPTDILAPEPKEVSEGIVGTELRIVDGEKEAGGG